MKRALLTVDLEDYRRQELRDHLQQPQPANPDEVTRQLDMLLEAFDSAGARATFFTVGRLVGELPDRVWADITGAHHLGCHSYEHDRVRDLGPARFREDIRRARGTLEDVAGAPVLSYRAPYFSADGCDPWFGEALAEEGYTLSSSARVSSGPAGFGGTYAVPGSDGAVTEVPLPCLGFGDKRLTVIGGTYFRLLPLPAIRLLLGRAEELGFIPLVYLHPYDVDSTAEALRYPAHPRYLKRRAGDWVRRRGRRSAVSKLLALTDTYTFGPVEGTGTNQDSGAEGTRTDTSRQ